MKPDHGNVAIRVFNVGLCTPLGLSAPVSQVEIAAGAARFQETEVLDQEGAPVRASILNRIKRGRKRTDRMCALAAAAARECVQALPAKRRWQLPVFLGLPAPKSGGAVDVDILSGRLQRAMPAHVQLDVAPSRLLRSGRAAFFQALAEATALVENNSVPLALVGAVDSYCDITSLTYLSMTGRNLGPSNPDGLIPGEGAGFLLLGRADALPTAPGPKVRVLACHVEQEARHFQQLEPNLGEGLTRVFRALRKHSLAGERRTNHLLSCQTGETFWAREFALASLRNGDLMPEPLRGNLIAETLGDAGAASGAIQLGVAQHWFQRHAGIEPPPRILIYGCSDEGAVGACVVAGE